MPEKSMRIQRALARAGVASRRSAEELVAAGRVKINGTVATTGQSVDPARDTITLDGKKVAAPARPYWIVFNKPSGIITTRSDPEGRRTVFDLVDDVPGLTYVGRLDYMTEGVLLLTTDGDAAHKLTHPSSEIERTYVASVRGDGGAAARAASSTSQIWLRFWRVRLVPLPRRRWPPIPRCVSAPLGPSPRTPSRSARS